MRPLRKDDEVEHNEHRFYSSTPPELHGHPLFGRGTMGIITADNPKYLSAGNNARLSADMKAMGLKHVQTEGSYGGRERSFIVHNPTREQMYRLGKKYGQEQVIYSQDGKHELMYTHGPNAGKAHYSLPSMHFSTTPPKDFYTHLPGYGYVGLHFRDEMQDTPVKWTMPLDHQVPADDLPLAKDEGEPPTFHEVKPEVFEHALSQHPNTASIDSDRDYTGKRTFLSGDGMAGYAIHQSGELNHVFSRKPGLGAHAVNDAIRNGAKSLSCFDGKLPQYYQRFGFQEHHREANWTPGQPDVVHMALAKSERDVVRAFAAELTAALRRILQSADS